MYKQRKSRLPERLRLPGLPISLIERVIGMPRWVFFVAAMAAIPLATLPVGALARYTTSSPAFCLSCHATGETPDRSTRSLAHADVEQVTCVDCHAKTGQVVFEGYTKGFMAEPDRVAGNCVRCHKEMTKTNEQTDFKRDYLGIRITHQAHLERGATCTTCHSNVAHDLAVPQTNRPSMQSCNTCHAKSDNCQKCHTNSIPTALPPVPVPSGPSATMADGKVYYLRVCSACHGAKGDAQASVNLSKQEVLNALGDKQIARAIELGKGAMPAFGVGYGGTLNREQIQAIMGYMASEAVGSGTPDGKALYDRNCVVCHGDSGDKVAGVQHSSPDFWASHPEGELVRVLTHGLGAMPALSKVEGGPLTSRDIRAVLDYLEQKAGVRRGPAQASTANGQPIYEQSCAACHGANGRQVPTADLGNKDFVAKLGDKQLVASIVDGKGGMPPLGESKGGKLSADQVDAVAQYVKSLAGLAPEPGGASVAQGKSLYAANCAGCHGANGAQIPSAPLASADFQKQSGDDGIAKATVDGKGGMPAMGKAKGGPLADDQIAAIVAYLKSVAAGQ